MDSAVAEPAAGGQGAEGAEDGQPGGVSSFEVVEGEAEEEDGANTPAQSYCAQHLCFYLEGESCPECVEESNAASEKSWNETVNADNPPGEWDVPPAEEATTQPTPDLPTAVPFGLTAMDWTFAQRVAPRYLESVAEARKGDEKVSKSMYTNALVMLKVPEDAEAQKLVFGKAVATWVRSADGDWGAALEKVCNWVLAINPTEE